MGNIEATVQTRFCHDIKMRRPQPLLMDHILTWASTLPISPLGIVDLGAGKGIEADQLNLQGYPCVGIDPHTERNTFSDLMSRLLGKKYSKKVFDGTVSRLPFVDHSFSGTLLKDVLVFLSPAQRIEMLTELKRKLVPGGSLLVISENTSVCTARYSGKQGRQSGTVVSDMFDSYNQWMSAIDQMMSSGETFYSIEYQTAPKVLCCLANQSGYSFQMEQEYHSTDSLALENRWTHNPGYIARLSLN